MGRLGATLRQGAWILIALLLTLPGKALAQPIMVDGLFYGSGDSALYLEWATSYYGSKLYIYYDVPSTTLFVALVVDPSVNDNVFGASDPLFSGNYMSSAGWGGGGGQQRGADRLTDSEFASFGLSCVTGTPQEWEWQQGYACDTSGAAADWVSDSTCPASAVLFNDYPMSLVSASSFEWNANTWEADPYNPTPPPPGAAWNMHVFGSGLADWKSPFDAGAPNTVAGLDHPTYSSTYEWEWAMVYEWSVNLVDAGCGNEPVFLITGLSHHSPMKADVEGDFDEECGEENDCFPPDDDPSEPLSDYGDLPDTYGTLLASGGAQHYITTTGPYLGSALDAELDGSPVGTGATGDDSSGVADEEGVTANVTSNWTATTPQSFTVTVTSVDIADPTCSNCVLGAWFDWNRDGDFDDPGEYFFTEDVVAGINTTILDVVVGADFDGQLHALSTRFRLFSSDSVAPGGSLGPTDSVGVATDGEVEDHVYAIGALPVTLNAFASEFKGGGLTVRWQTATETDNVGFELLGRVRGEWQPLGEFVASQGMSSALPQNYEVEIFPPAGLSEIDLVDYDTHGLPERFGPFGIGAGYGEFQPIRRVDWTKPRAERAARLRERGFSNTGRQNGARAGGAPVGEVAQYSRWRKLQESGPGRGSSRRFGGSGAVTFELEETETIRLETGSVTHVAVTEPGIQRVSYQTLRDAGLDLAGARNRDIAVTWRGEPVARWIEGNGVFGPGSAIEFIGRSPRGDDALYIDANLYQVSIDPARARPAHQIGQGRARNVSDAYLRDSMVDRPVLYHRQSPTGDPWIERVVLVRGAPRTVTLDVPVEEPVLDGPSRLIVGLGTVTDLPDLIGPGGEILPEHNVEVWFSGPGSNFAHVTTASTSGQQDWRIEAVLPQGMLQGGLNRLQLRFDTDYFYSLVLIDRYGVRYPGPYLGPELDFGSDPGAEGYRVEGFGSPSIVAYAEDEDGTLTRIEPWVTPSGSGGYAAELRQLDPAHFWVDESPHTPAVFTTEAPAGLLAGPAELIVIADGSFVGSPALDDYLAEKSAFNPVVIDVEDIYNSVGFGMALPEAITDYLKVRNEVSPFTHVQLVGTDCYDRLNYVSDCISSIPLPTAPVGVTIYSPSQNRLVDLDGDGVGDKAVGQFSVRDEAELATIVQKGAEWSASGVSSQESALLIAEETDGIHGFRAQIERLKLRLGWSATEVLDMTDHPDVNTAREVLRTELDSGRTVTMFSGHSSPTVWAFRSLLTASSAKTLTNFGRPTVMVPLACETTYDISPNAEVLGHQLLYAGGQGALAISGAVALSSLDDNERMAGFILDGLKSGLTLGEAVQVGRDGLGIAYQTLQDNWMTQGDVTARIAP